MPPRKHGLELKRDDQFIRREWRVQRVAFLGWALVLVAALAGLLGSGPLSRATATSETGAIRVAYNRYLHYHSPADFRVTLSSNESSGRFLRLKLSEEFLSRVEIQRIHPEPVRSELADDGAVFVFERALGTDQPVQIVFYVEYQEYGVVSARIELNERETLAFQQWVYP